MCVEAVADAWDNRGIQANIAFPDGRVLVGAGGFLAAPPKVIDGHAMTLNAGPLTFEVKRPLTHWTMAFDGSAYETMVQAQANGVVDGPRRKVLIEIDAFMGPPPWTPGEAAIRCWMSALFPSGKAFGILAFPPRRDGTAAYSETFLFDSEKKIYGKVLEAPWMTRFEPHGGACDIVIKTEAGESVRIEGRTHDTTFIARGTPMFGDWTYEGGPHGVALPFHQGGAQYVWDGERAYGMIERPLPVEEPPRSSPAQN